MRVSAAINKIIQFIVTALWGKERAKQAGVVLAAVVAAKALPPDPAGLYTKPGPTMQERLDAALDGSGFRAVVGESGVTISGEHDGHSISTMEQAPGPDGLEAWAKSRVDRLKELADGL